MVGCLVIPLASCATAPGVVSTEARSGSPVVVSTLPVATTLPATPSTPDESTPPIVSLPISVPPTTVAVLDEDGVGDAMFPALGNPGIDVEHYTLVLDYDPVRNKISATEHVDILMTEDRATFTLDSDGPIVSAVSVDGAPAAIYR